MTGYARSALKEYVMKCHTKNEMRKNQNSQGETKIGR